MKAAFQSRAGYTAVELLIVLALSAILLGGVVVSYGTLSRGHSNIGTYVEVPLGGDRLMNFYGIAGSTRNTPTAPHYGTMAQAQALQELFYSDVISATAVFCLPRDSYNTWRPATIPYDPAIHGELDTPQRFRAHCIAAAGIAATLYRDYRNPLNDGSTVPQNATVFILGFSKTVNQLKVNAIYDIDVIRFTGSTQPQGYHASVKRYAEDPGGTDFPLTYSSGYEVFFPPSVPNPNPNSPNQWSTDGFTPLFITFERSARRAIVETPTTINRFKAAAEQPFYFLWWPDPGARHLGPVANTLSASDPRQAYNHMAGRTSLMFTVPMFPAM